MNTATRGSTMQFNPNKAVAIAVWLAAVYTTHQLIITASETQYAIMWAFGVQGVLTIIESRAFNGHRDYLSMSAVGFDTLVNAGGLWFVIRNLDQTPMWAMLQELLNFQSDLGKVPAALLAFGIGYMLAATPERAWKW